jgi:uncharacterized protein (DUF2267 family)
MDHDTFIDLVAAHAGIDREAADRAVRATLQTLAARISREEARHLAAQLPPEVAPWIATTTPAAGFDADEFVRRVAERAGSDLRGARRWTAAVFDALARTVSREEWDDMVAELPSDFAPLLPRGPYLEVVDLETFLGLVAEHAGVDSDLARRATEATLETLAERIDGGEVDDLIERLPAELHPALRRGRDTTGGRATRLPLDAFVMRVAEREGVGDLEAVQHAHAVFLALRETVGDDEFFDVTAQLPEEYVRTLAR